MGNSPITNPLQQAQWRLYNGGNTNPLFQTPGVPNPATDPSQASTPPNPSISQPNASPAPSQTPFAPSSPSPSPSDGAAALYGSAAAKPPMSAQDFAAANPDASKAYMPPRPVGSFDAGSHPELRRALATLFAGVGEFGGDLNHNPGTGTRMLDQWNQQDLAQRQYDQPQNQERMKAGALSQAYTNYLGQGEGAAGIGQTQAETRNLLANVPLLQQQRQFLEKVRGLKEAGKYGSDEDLFNSVLPEAGTIPGMTRQMIVDQINAAKTLGSKYTITRDPQTQAPIELVDRQGNHYSQSNLPKDPEAQQMWNDAATAAAGKEQVEEGKEKRVAGYAADRQVQAFSNQETERGKQAAATSLADINDAKNQQQMIENLMGGKMNPTSQTAAMFKMIGLEQPTGTHRIMPAEIEGIEQQGGLSDRLKQKLLNWKEGDRFSPDLIPDVVSTAKTLSQNKIKTANDNLESTARIYGYKAPGSDAKGRLDKPEDYQDQMAAGGAGAAQHVPGGQAQGLTEGATGKGSDGKNYVVKGGIWVLAGK